MIIIIINHHHYNVTFGTTRAKCEDYIYMCSGRVYEIYQQAMWPLATSGLPWCLCIPLSRPRHTCCQLSAVPRYITASRTLTSLCLHLLYVLPAYILYGQRRCVAYTSTCNRRNQQCCIHRFCCVYWRADVHGSWSDYKSHLSNKFKYLHLFLIVVDIKKTALDANTLVVRCLFILVVNAISNKLLQEAFYCHIYNLGPT